MENRKVFIVDGSGYIFRAYYGVTSLSTKDGFPTNALLGFTRMLKRLLQDSEATHVFVVFDAGRKTFRNDLYPEYKANRSEAPEDLVPQFPFFREISTALGLQVLEAPGYEADDIIGTLVKRYEDAGCEIVIVSGDKDLSQMIDDKVSVWDTMHDKYITREQVIAKFGVPPEKVVEVLALTGDTSDNIPGVKGVGPKTAAQLIEKYGDVEAVIANIENIRVDASIRGRAKIAEAIQDGADLLRLSRKLVEIKIDAPFTVRVEGTDLNIVDMSAEDLFAASSRREPLIDHLTELFTRFEFTSLLKELNLHVKAAPKVQSNEAYKTIFKDSFDSWLKELKAQKHFAFDLETTSLDPFEAKIVGASFCWSEDCAFYIPIGHVTAPEGKEQVSIEYFLAAVKEIFTSPQWKKCGQNLKYDLNILGVHGIEVQGVVFDSMLAAYLINPDKNAFNMTALAKEFLGRTVIEYDDLEGVAENFSHVSIEHATQYAAEDAHIAWLLMQTLQPMLADRNLENVFNTIEIPLIPVLSRLERAGVKIDTTLLANMSEEFGVELNEIRGKLVGMAGTDFNLNSPKQLAEILFGKLGISTKGVKKTKTGFSTDSSVLEMLSADHDFPKEVLRYRMLFKLKSTYIDSLPSQISSVTGRLHSKFNQTVAATGRLSSSEPNLQNIPIQSKEGRRIRGAFVAEKGRTIISADYSQIELRILAHMSGDANLIQAFVDNVDIHAKTAREILQIPQHEDVPSELRRIGKTLNFGIIYGMSGFRLGKELGIPLREADSYIQNYFNRYPGVKEFFARLEHEAATIGEVSTLFGRKRMINLADMTGRDKGFINRIAVNAPIQGTAADIIKLAMLKLDERIQREKLPLLMTLQVHDELVFECDSDFASTASEIITGEMERVTELAVPLRADVGIGQSWEQAH